MGKLDVTIQTVDGSCPATLHVPDDGLPRPAVIMYPDAGGARESFWSMASRLAGHGYAVLVPDVYYRHGTVEPFSMSTVFTDTAERRRLMGLVQSVTPDMVNRDAEAFAAFLAARPEVSAGPLGTTGYCMGGRISLTVAGHLGDGVAAAASFHGGRLAVEDDPGSPHHLAGSVRAEVYVGGARDDASFGPEQAELLHRVYEAAGVQHTIEEYDAEHGYAVPDNPPFDEAAAERHWTAMTELYARTLGR